MRAVLLLVFLSGLALAGCTTAPSQQAGNRQDAVQTYVQLGLSYLGNGQRAQARHNLLRALELDRNNPPALHAMALLYQTEGEYELADQHFRRALSHDPAFTQGRMNYARFLFLQGRTQQARDEYRRVTQDTNYRLRADAFVGLALADMRLGNRESGRESLERALRLNPSLATALLEAGDVAYEDGDYVLAREYLTRYEQNAQHSARSLWLGIRLAQTFSDRDRAASYGLALLEIYPDSREANQYRLSRND